jgi:hypothetical protein
MVKTTAAMAKTTAAKATTGISQFSLSDLRPARVDVVEVREKDLKEMPLGKERALAFDRERKRSFWSFLNGNFKEPTLPSIEDGDMDGSLLPPKPL